MNIDQFTAKNAEQWSQLENLSTKLKSRKRSSLTKDDINQFWVLYNQACSHLSYAKTNFFGSETEVYLNALVGKCHSLLYYENTSHIRDFLRFFSSTFPLLLRQNLRYFATSIVIFLVGLVLSFVLTQSNIENARIFLGDQTASQVLNSNGKSTAELINSPIMSSIIMTNNIKVALFSFVLGITAGIGTAWILLTNSFMLGSLWSIVYFKKQQFIFWSLILPHGVLELFSIFVCSAAGLIIGHAIISPGNYSWKDSLITRSKTAIQLVMGTIPIFVIAGIIEGYFTPAPIAPMIKLYFAGGTFVLLSLYLFFCGRVRK